MKYDADWQRRLRAIQPAACVNGHSFDAGAFEVNTRDEQATYTCSECADEQTFELTDDAAPVAPRTRTGPGFHRGHVDHA